MVMIGLIILFAFLIILFLGLAPNSNQKTDFHELWLKQRVFFTIMCLLGVSTTILNFWGKSP